MKKEYIYDPRQYLVQVTISSFVCIAIFFLSIFMIIIDFNRNLFFLAAIVSFYASWNALISRSTPSKIVMEEDGISFIAFGKTIKYLFEEIYTFRVKDFRYSGKMFIRINNYNIFNGRYWINTKGFNDSDELYLFFLRLEYKTHPDSIKSRAWDSTRPDVEKMPVLPWNLSVHEEKSEV